MFTGFHHNQIDELCFVYINFSLISSKKLLIWIESQFVFDSCRDFYLYFITNVIDIFILSESSIKYAFIGIYCRAFFFLLVHQKSFNLWYIFYALLLTPTEISVPNIAIWLWLLIQFQIKFKILQTFSLTRIPFIHLFIQPTSELSVFSPACGFLSVETLMWWQAFRFWFLWCGNSSTFGFKDAMFSFDAHLKHMKCSF